MNLEGRCEWQGCVFVGKEEGENQNRRLRMLKRCTLASCMEPTLKHLPFLSSSWLLFPLYSDKLLLFRYIVWTPVWLQVFWHATYFFLYLPGLAVKVDWQAHSSVQHTAPPSLWWRICSRWDDGLLLPELEYLQLLHHQDQSGWWRQEDDWKISSFLIKCFHVLSNAALQTFLGGCVLNFVCFCCFVFFHGSKVWIDQKTRLWNYTPISCFINLPYFIFCPWINKPPEP